MRKARERRREKGAICFEKINGKVEHEGDKADCKRH